MNLDQPWKIAALLGLLAFLRITWGLWASAPARKLLIEAYDSGLIAILLVFVIIRPFVVQAFYIPSPSMVPSLLPGDRILVNKFVYRLNAPKRGDVIVFDAPRAALDEDGAPKDFVKRLVGLPGDKILIRSGEGVFVNGRLLEDPPGVPLPSYDWPLDAYGFACDEPYAVPAGTYFVLGDNRNVSHDSHEWADPDTGEPRPELVSRRVLGKAMVIFWPPGRIELVRDGGRAGQTTRGAHAAVEKK